MNEQYRFISYTPTPNDLYTTGLVEVEVNIPVVLRYKRAKDKQGHDFYVSASHNIQESGGNKSYKPSFEIDSRNMSEKILTMIRQKVKAYEANGNNAVQEEIVYPHGLLPSEPAPTAVEVNLPF